MSLKKKPVKAPEPIKGALLAAEQANIQELHEKALVAAYEHGWNDHAARVLELAHETKAQAEPAARSWLERMFD